MALKLVKEFYTSLELRAPDNTYSCTVPLDVMIQRVKKLLGELEEAKEHGFVDCVVERSDNGHFIGIHRSMAVPVQK